MSQELKNEVLKPAIITVMQPPPVLDHAEGVCDSCECHNYSSTVYVGNPSEQEQVREFTAASCGFPIPREPVSLSVHQVKNLIRFVMTELAELSRTVTLEAGGAETLMRETLEEAWREHIKAHPSHQSPQDPDAFIGEQADALVDIIYFVYNAAAKSGIDLSRVFDEVHAANMRKRFPDGTFHRRSDGKVEKPEGWKAPDVARAIREQRADAQKL